MKRAALASLAILATAGLPAQSLSILPGSTATFLVHARRMFTHEVIIGINTGVSGTVQTPAAVGGTVTARVEIDAAGFKTGDDLRDEHVRGALKAMTSPKITFTLSALPGFNGSVAQSQTLTAQGSFNVGGHAIDLAVPLTVVQSDGHWRVTGETATGFKALQVTPPGMPILVSVEDGLIVKVDLLVEE